MKDAIAKRVQAKQPQRQQFLKQSVQVLKPFLEPKVLQHLQAFPSLNNAIVDTQANYLQPDSIKADMHDYQLQRLNG